MAKATTPQQHNMLHQVWPTDCCLCGHEERIKLLEEALKGLLPLDELGRCFFCNFNKRTDEMMHLDYDNCWDGDQPCLLHERYKEIREALGIGDKDDRD